MAGISKVVRFASVLSVLFVALSGAALAQSHGAAGGSGHPAGSIAPRVRPMPIRPGATVGTPLNPNFAPIRNVPGLSFNIQALAAADRHNFRRSRRSGVVAPLLWYSPYYSPYLDYDEEPAPPYDYSYGQAQSYGQPPIYGQPPSYAQPQYGQPQAVPPPAPPAEPPASLEPQPPPPDVGQFALVRLDGQVIFASAFMATNGRVTYVTREGIRRSFPISELDQDATRQMNEANGTSISLPN